MRRPMPYPLQQEDPNGVSMLSGMNDPNSVAGQMPQMAQAQPQAQPQPQQGGGNFFSNLFSLPGEVMNAYASSYGAIPERVHMEMQAKRDAEAQQQQQQQALAAFAQSLPTEDMRRAFLADPPGFLSHWEPNLGPQNLKGGESSLSPGIGGIPQVRTAPEMFNQAGVMGTHTAGTPDGQPGSVTIDNPGARLPGTVSASDGLLIDNNLGPQGSYSKPVTDPQTGAVWKSTPSFNYRPPMPQVGAQPPAGQAAPAPAPAFAPPSGPPGGMPQVGQGTGPPPPPAPPTAPTLSAIRADPAKFFSTLFGRPVTITSGYRSPEKNARTPGASRTSEHMTNSAWDIQVPGMSTTQVAQALAASNLGFDQVIDEGSHTHIGFGPKTRGQALQGGAGQGYRPLATSQPIPQVGGGPPAQGPISGPVTAPDGSVSSQGGIRQLTPGTPPPAKPTGRPLTAAERVIYPGAAWMNPDHTPGYAPQGAQGAGRRAPVSVINRSGLLQEQIGTAASTNRTIDLTLHDLDAGALKLGPIDNTISGVRNWAGMSDEHSRAYASFQSTLERMRNDSLRLNAGVQTDGDAQRAWAEIGAHPNDPEVVRTQLSRIRDLNEQAIEIRAEEVNQIREDAGLQPIDPVAVANRVHDRPKGTPVSAPPAATRVPAAPTGAAAAPQPSAIPPPAQRRVGQTYQTPNGPHVWAGNGWQAP